MVTHSTFKVNFILKTYLLVTRSSYVTAKPSLPNFSRTPFHIYRRLHTSLCEFYFILRASWFMSVYWPRDSLFPLEIVLSEPKSSMLYSFLSFSFFPLSIFYFKREFVPFLFAPIFPLVAPVSSLHHPHFSSWYW